MLHQLNGAQQPSNALPNANSINSNNVLDRYPLPNLPYSNNKLLNQLPNQPPNLPNNLPTSPSTVPQSSDQQQIFVLCSLLATSLFFLLLLILFILFKQRRRHFKNKNKATILQLDKLGSDEQQQMLLLMQQNYSSQQVSSSLTRSNPPAQILISGNNRGYLQQPAPMANQQANQTDLGRSDKMHLITRLNPGGTMIDHLLVRNADNNLQQSSAKRTSPFGTINGNLPVLPVANAVSNSNVSSSLTTASVNSNPSHNSSADEDHPVNNPGNQFVNTTANPLGNGTTLGTPGHQATPKYGGRNHSLLETPNSAKASPMFANKLNLTPSRYSNKSYLVGGQQQLPTRPDYAYKLEEPDYAEPMLQSLQSSTGDLEKFTANGKRSINSQSNSSNRTPSDSDNYDNYDQFETYESQYYDQCGDQQYPDNGQNNNYSYKNGNEYQNEYQNDYPNESQFREYVETDNLLEQDGYDSLVVEQNAARNGRPPLPKTLPPSSYSMLNQSRYNGPAGSKFHPQTLGSNDAFGAKNGPPNGHHNLNNLNSNLNTNCQRFTGSNHQLLSSSFLTRGSNRKMQFQTSSPKLSSSTSTTNSTANGNATTNAINNKFIEVS